MPVTCEPHNWKLVDGLSVGYPEAVYPMVMFWWCPGCETLERQTLVNAGPLLEAALAERERA